MNKTLISFFQKGLYKWASETPRPMPWKGEKNPYLIWLSEIILQQTRVEQGLPYFEKFKERYPTVKDLANASEDEVMKMWEGLGYYSRARNLHFTAKFISNDLDGVFPSDFDSIKMLKGVGDYTASAIASFAYDLPHAVLDGNVFRIFSRFLGIETAIDSTAGKKEFKRITQEFLDKKEPAKYNQSIMDFGAKQCTPKNPDCKNCPLNKKCIALEKNLIEKLPLKSKKLVKKTRHFNFLVFKKGNLRWIEKREGKDIWKNLYQFPIIESIEAIDELMKLKFDDTWTPFLEKKGWKIFKKSRPFKQTLTHQNIIAVFWEFEIEDETFSSLVPSLIRVNQNSLLDFAFPKIIDLYLKDKTLTLNLM